MSALLLAILLIGSAAVTANLAVALTALVARRVPVEANLSSEMLLQLVRRPLWRLAAALDAGGWVLKTLALLVAPLTVVAPSLASGLFLLYAFAYVMLGERLVPRALVGVGLIAGGIALVAVHSPERVVTVASGERWILVAAILGAGAVAVFVIRNRRGRQIDPRLIAVSVGCAWALNGLLSKLMADSADSGRWVLLVGAFVAAFCVGALGYTAKTSALQAGAATTVESIVAVVSTLVQVAMAPVLFGEAWPSDPDDAVLLGSGILLVAAGVWLLTRASTRVYQLADRVEAGAEAPADR